MGEWADGRMRLIDENVRVWMGEWMGRKNGWVDMCMYGWLDGCMHAYMDE